MVASPHSLASAAGVDALRAGGSAVDAAIATGAALSVLYPHMTSVGGDAFWLIYDAEARRVRHLNGGGRAAKGASIAWFRSRGMNEIPLRGFLPATLSVPGGVASWGEPLSATYRGVEIFETPPPTQGFTVLEMLNLIESYDIGRMDPLGPELAHLLVQAKQIAYHDRDGLLADPEFRPVPVERLISKPYAAERRRLISAERALPWDLVPSYGTLAGDTVFVCAVDAEGNAAALIQSLYFTFGSGVVAGDTGVVLQNRSAYFSLDPLHPNRLEPGKRPMHTLIASIALKAGRPWQVLGCMGADGQPQIHLQSYVGLVDFGFDIQEALEMPRWLSGRFNIGDSRDLLNMEARFPQATIGELERRGHAVNRWPDWCELGGHAHGITIDFLSGARVGGSDPRSDGAAIGY